MKMLKVALAVLVMAAMVTPVIAEDRLSLNGEMRVRGWHDDSEVDKVDASDNARSWIDQRLRIGGKIAVAEGVSITFRTDITETAWGAGGSDFGAGRGGGTQQWDRAHLDLDFDAFHLRAGQQFFGTGVAWAFDTQEAGLNLTLKGLPLQVFWTLDNDNTVKKDTALTPGDLTTGKASDAMQYGFISKLDIEGIERLAFFAVGQSKRNNSNEEVYLIGANTRMDLGPVKLVGELDFFTGDAAEDATGKTIDAMGTQLFVDASMAATDMVTVGGQIFYSLGDDEDVQYTGLGNGFNGWDPIFDVGTSLSNEEMDLGDNLACDYVEGCGGVFDWTGGNAGTVGGRLYLSTKIGEGALGASFAYLETEEDDAVEADAMFYAAGFSYPILENTSFHAQLQYTDASVDSIAKVKTDTDWDSFQAGTGVFVKF